MNVTCYECGDATSLAGSFREVRRSFRSKNVYYCPACHAKRQRRTTVFSLWVLLAAIALLFAGWVAFVFDWDVKRWAVRALNFALLCYRPQAVLRDSEAFVT